MSAQSLQIGLAATRLLDAAHRYESALRSYYRTTGKITTPEIAQNYIEVAVALGLLRMRESVVEPNATAVALSCFDGPTDTMALTFEERILFFEHLVNIVPCVYEIRAILSRLNETPNLAPSEFKGIVANAVANDHVVKSHLEWLIDLKLVGSSRQSRGDFHLTDRGKTVADAVPTGTTDAVGTFVSAYASPEIGAISLEMPADSTVHKAVLAAVSRVRSRVNSPIDRRLIPADPVLAVARVTILTESRRFVNREQLINHVARRAIAWRIVFSWNRAYNSGHFRVP